MFFAISFSRYPGAEFCPQTMPQTDRGRKVPRLKYPDTVGYARYADAWLDSAEGGRRRAEARSVNAADFSSEVCAVVER